MEEEVVENDFVSSNISVEKLEKLKNTIETMDKLNQIEILKIITNNKNKIKPENLKEVLTELKSLEGNFEKVSKELEELKKESLKLRTRGFQYISRLN